MAVNLPRWDRRWLPTLTRDGCRVWRLPASSGAATPRAFCSRLPTTGRSRLGSPMPFWAVGLPVSSNLMFIPPHLSLSPGARFAVLVCRRRRGGAPSAGRKRVARGRHLQPGRAWRQRADVIQGLRGPPDPTRSGGTAFFFFLRCGLRFPVRCRASQNSDLRVTFVFWSVFILGTVVGWTV